MQNIMFEEHKGLETWKHCQDVISSFNNANKNFTYWNSFDEMEKMNHVVYQEQDCKALG